MLGGTLALLAAAVFAFSNVSIRRGVLTGSVLQGLSITVPIGIPLFLAAALIAGSLGAVERFTVSALANLCLAGFAHFVWGRYCNYRTINAIGANLAAPVQQSSLLFSLVFAVWFLGEVLTSLRLVGIAFVVLGPAILLRARRSQRGSGTGKSTTVFEPRFAEGYLFAVLSALGYGASPILIRAALQGADPGTSIAGGLVSYSAATVILVPVLLRRGSRRQIFAVDRQAARWFTTSGVFVCASQMMRYVALALAPVTVVAPIMRISVVFRILFGWFVNREHEVFDARIVVGVFLSLLGALALTLDTELVLSLLPLPDWAAAAARRQWPAS
jgi:drug/metabolite transporter (DMT)-like permease